MLFSWGSLSPSVGMFWLPEFMQFVGGAPEVTVWDWVKLMVSLFKNPQPGKPSNPAVWTFSNNHGSWIRMSWSSGKTYNVPCCRAHVTRHSGLMTPTNKRALSPASAFQWKPPWGYLPWFPTCWGRAGMWTQQTTCLGPRREHHNAPSVVNLTPFFWDTDPCFTFGVLWNYAASDSLLHSACESKCACSSYLFQEEHSMKITLCWSPGNAG